MDAYILIRFSSVDAPTISKAELFESELEKVELLKMGLFEEAFVWM